ncbi:MAG: diacylglycerol kinase [Pseudomonadota bacterium]
MGKPDNTGFLRVIRAAKYSAQGFAHAWRHESAFRQELTLAVIMAPIAVWLGRTPMERTLLISVCLLVLLTELLNSAIEAAIDRFGEELHELSGRAKDLGSAAVTIALMICGLVWGTVIYDRFVAAVI